MGKSAFQITVAIPTYNSEKFIEEAIDSIVKQSHKFNEIIVADDNSIDKTLSILEDLRSSDQRITIIGNEENLGYAKNWNKCFEYCKTKYLVILHHDDILKEYCIEKQINFLNVNPECAFVGAHKDLIDENGNI